MEQSKKVARCETSCFLWHHVDCQVKHVHYLIISRGDGFRMDGYPTHKTPTTLTRPGGHAADLLGSDSGSCAVPALTGPTEYQTGGFDVLAYWCNLACKSLVSTLVCGRCYGHHRLWKRLVRYDPWHQLRRSDPELELSNLAITLRAIVHLVAFTATIHDMLIVVDNNTNRYLLLLLLLSLAPFISVKAGVTPGRGDPTAAARCATFSRCPLASSGSGTTTGRTHTSCHICAR